jgi:hypothetical protein
MDGWMDGWMDGGRAGERRTRGQNSCLRGEV